MDDKKKEEEEKKDLLEQIIFNGYGIKIINRFNKDWGFKTLNRQEHAKVWSISTIVHDDATSWLNFKITVVKTALISINNIEVDDESKELIFPKLPTQVIDELFTEYQKLDKMQLEAIDNLEQIKEMSKDFFSRVRFKVMKSAGALPTEDRVKKMNDHQWFYYYYQLLEDEKEEEEKLKNKMDYMAFYMNPELAVKYREQQDSLKSQAEGKKTNIPNMKAHEEVNPYNPNQIISYGDTTMDESFDEKIKMFMTDDQVTELSDDVRKGNAMESKEDFLARAMANTDIVKKENEKVLNSIKKDAEKAGVNPDDLDAIEIN
jgi:hypothetical protein